MLQGLSKLIGDHAPAGVKAQKFENFFGRKLAIDASMSMYQFLVRSCGHGAMRHPPDARPWNVIEPSSKAMCCRAVQRRLPFCCVMCNCDTNVACSAMCCTCRGCWQHIAGLSIVRAQVVVGRQGDQLLSNEAGDITRCAVLRSRSVCSSMQNSPSHGGNRRSWCRSVAVLAILLMLPLTLPTSHHKQPSSTKRSCMC